MHSVRGTVRLLVPFACAALLALSGCVVAYHDGLPAWTPPAGRTEGSIGYHRVLSPGSSSGIWYLTPGARIGLARPPLAADVGLASAVVADGGDMTAMLGPVLGIGYQGSSVCIVLRPSAYLLCFSGGEVVASPWWQVSLLAGSSVQSGRTHISGGGRASQFGAGPVFLVDRSYGPVNLRVEGSYMLPYATYVYGPYSDGQLTLGLTVGGPAP
jgi:hypothetical protein